MDVDDEFAPDMATDPRVIAWPLDVHIFIRDTWTGKCVAQRMAHNSNNHVLTQTLGARFTVRYHDLAQRHMFTGVIDEHVLVN